MFNPWDRHMWPNHDETNPVIDELVRQGARAIENGKGKITKEDIQRSLVEDRGMDPGEAFNIAVAADLLAVKK